MIQIPLDKELIIRDFLQPIGRLSEECSINLTNDQIYTLTSDSTDSIILYCKILTTTGLENPLTINLKDVKKLTRVFECISKPIIDIKIDEQQSVLKYNSPEIRFKLHLVQDNVIRKSKVSLEKLLQLKFDTEFDVEGNKFQEVLKGGQFSPDTNKVYFSQDGDKIYCEITDKAVSDLDSITYEVASNIEGEHLNKPTPINIEALRIINQVKRDTITVKFNKQFGFFGFSLKDNNSEMLYVVSAMVK